MGRYSETMVLKVGSHAAQTCEPRQVRKEATVSEALRVPWVCLTRAVVLDMPTGSKVDGRCAVSILSLQDVLTPLTTPRSRPRKALGQHYLADGAFLSRIIAAAELGPQDVVVEVGPGPGSLTRRLVEHAGRVVAVEVDRNLAATLPHRLDNPPNLTVVEADARTADIAALVGGHASYKVVSNLPYYAANPIIRRFLEAEAKPALMVVMVQREVALGMLARPGKVSVLSMAVQYYAVPRLVCNVPPRAFRPAPKVTSSVIRLDIHQRPPVAVDDAGAFFETVRAGFSAPRKQLRNSLSQGLHTTGGVVDSLLDSLDIDGRRRAETLTLEEWAEVHGAWQRFSRPGG